MDAADPETAVRTVAQQAQAQQEVTMLWYKTEIM